MKPRRLWAALVMTILLLVYLGWESWFLKDVLGPGTDWMPRHGKTAWAEFARQFWLVAAVGLAVIALEIALITRCRRKQSR